MHNGAVNYTLKVLRVQGETVGGRGVAVSHTWTEGGRKQWQAEWDAGEPGHMDCRSFRVVSTSSWSMWFFSRSTSSSSVCQQKLPLNIGSPHAIPNFWCYDGRHAHEASISPSTRYAMIGGRGVLQLQQQVSPRALNTMCKQEIWSS